MAIDIKWDYRFLTLAELVSTWSKDPSTKVGAVICKGKKVIGMGYNGFPQKLCDDECLYEDREIKYGRVLHAEENAIFDALTRINNLKGCTIYTTPLPPCNTCALKIIQTGITRVVAPRTNNERWKTSCLQSKDLFNEACVRYDLLNNEKHGTYLI